MVKSEVVILFLDKETYTEWSKALLQSEVELRETQLYSERVHFLVLPLRAREDSMESVLHLRLAFGKCPQTILVEKLEQYPLAWEQSGRPWQQCGDRMDLTFCEEWKQP